MKRFRILLSIETSHGHGRSIIDGATRYIDEQGGSIEFEGQQVLDAAPRWLGSWNGDGILVRTHRKSTCRVLRAGAIPFVQLYCKNDRDGYDVGCDERTIGEMAVEHFYEQGHRNFAMFSQGGPQKEFHWARIREEGFVEAVRRRGLTCPVFLCPKPVHEPVTLWAKGDRKRLSDWLRNLPKPVAVFCLTDMYSRRVADWCTESGLSVPEEIAVLGVDNDDWFCGHHTPSLSSLDQNGFRIGFEAAALLYKKLRKEPLPPLPIFVPPIGVVKRGSTDSLAIADADLVAAASFIRNHCGENLAIDDVVAEVGLSRRTLERKFLKQFGRTLGQEINRVRLESAAVLLRDTAIPVGGVARRCGFGTHGYFISAFQKKFQLTPTEYRRRYGTK